MLFFLSFSLSFPDFNHRLTLEIDASATGFGAISSQQGKIVRVIHRKTTVTEAALPAPFLELAAIVWAVDRLHVYLHGAEFTIIQIIKASSGYLRSSAQRARWRCGPLY